ncbi:MAG TPA: hypothetical protein ENJ44_08625, partial [Oceanospirillales bacterium]|nr:hypothetical protein [Oceanospirillales bacterium]
MKNQKLDQFTNQYKISKTIRNELIPIGKTADWIKQREIILHEKSELKGKDAIRASNYKYAKKLFDEMHRIFIEDCLSSISEIRQQELKEIILEIALNESLDKHRKAIAKLFKFIFDEQANRWIFEYKYEMPEFWRIEIDELTSQFNETKDKKQQKYLSSIIKKLQKKIDNPKVDKAGIAALYSNTSAFQLLEWKILSGNIKITGKDLGLNESDEPLPANALIKIIRSFDGFHSYFSGFNENRANIYDLSVEENKFKSTAIVHRIFEQNLFFHIANIKNWQIIIKSLNEFENHFIESNYDWKQKLQEVESNISFSYKQTINSENFLQHLSQSGIEKYNEIIGGKAAIAGKDKIKGLNEWINLTRQQAGAKRNKFPPLKQLYKQILSKGRTWFIEEYKDDK